MLYSRLGVVVHANSEQQLLSTQNLDQASKARSMGGEENAEDPPVVKLLAIGGFWVGEEVVSFLRCCLHEQVTHVPVDDHLHMVSTNQIQVVNNDNHNNNKDINLMGTKMRLKVS